MSVRVVVLGAGFGGLELVTRLSDEFGDEIDVTLVDQSEAFVFGFSKLDVMFGRTVPEAVRHPYRDLDKPGMRFVQTTIRSIDPDTRRVQTESGELEGDILVIALGADLDPDATRGLREAGHEFYSVEGAFEARDVLASFEGGKVVLGVLSTPFKCPPAPSETVLMLHDQLVERGLRGRSEIALAIDFGRPIPPAADASEALVLAFAERGIDWRPRSEVCELDPRRSVAKLRDGGELPFDLFLAVPVHRAPRVVLDSGMTIEGWVPVDSRTLETQYKGVYAIGDVAAVGTPRAGVFAERQAVVAAEHIAARIRGTTSDAEYRGRGICYLEFGHGEVGLVDVTFFGNKREGALIGPSTDYATDKLEFGTSRIKRWFGRDWSAARAAPADVSTPAD